MKGSQDDPESEQRLELGEQLISEFGGGEIDFEVMHVDTVESATLTDDVSWAAAAAAAAHTSKSLMSRKSGS